MNLEFKHGVGSKSVPRAHGPMPAIERTEGEKIRIAKAFLEKRGFAVLPLLLSPKEVAQYLGCSGGHLLNLQKDSDFPPPFNIGMAKKSIDSPRRCRWRTTDVTAWLESRKEAHDA